jgi:hypothetical protein
LKDGPCLHNIPLSNLQLEMTEVAHVTITNPHVMIVIPEQIDVTMRKAIFWSVTGSVAGLAAASMLGILLLD